MKKSALVWIRRDLRLHDHAALAAATQRAERVAVVFVFDTEILKHLQDRDDRRLTFIHGCLKEVDEQLRAEGSRLIVLHGDPVEEIPRLAAQLQVEELHFNRDYEPYAIQRDALVTARVSAEVHHHKDTVVMEADEVRTGSGGPFKVYTPYGRAWRNTVRERDLAERVVHPGHWWPAQDLGATSSLPSLEDLGFQPGNLFITPGTQAGTSRLLQFGQRMAHYGERRNFPAEDGTSNLSPYFRHGALSIRQAFRYAATLPSEGSEKWQAELIWREFYQMILAEFPHVVRGACKPEMDAVEWQHQPDHLQAWIQGQTGYPIIDAAMRCFRATGWMHNRLRMVVASFLTKDLLIHWQEGESYFARMLLDFDLAQNNGGWQWAASTGVDAQPYFRIFNPKLQSERFDPKGEFIREWVPELTGLDGKSIHAPAESGPLELLAAGVTLGQNYPRPIVDHATQKPLAIQMLASIAPVKA